MPYQDDKTQLRDTVALLGIPTLASIPDLLLSRLAAREQKIQANKADMEQLLNHIFKTPKGILRKNISMMPASEHAMSTLRSPGKTPNKYVMFFPFENPGSLEVIAHEYGHMLPVKKSWLAHRHPSVSGFGFKPSLSLLGFGMYGLGKHLTRGEDPTLPIIQTALGVPLVASRLGEEYRASNVGYRLLEKMYRKGQISTAPNRSRIMSGFRKSYLPAAVLTPLLAALGGAVYGSATKK